MNPAAETGERLRSSLSGIVLGQGEAVEDLITALLAGGHVLLEGAPGVAKTLLAKALALLLDIEYRRIQFTPDLMPADVLGTHVWRRDRGAFEFIPGPIFTDVLLADEVNRTPPKTQAALLEAMEERQVTVEGEMRPLSAGFFVVATQNPIEQEGTYPLPEAQLDRFLMKILVPYPEREEELKILASHQAGFDPHRLAEAGVGPVAGPEDLDKARRSVRAVRMEADVQAYALDLVRATRASRRLVLGASPRAAVLLAAAARARAALEGEEFAAPDHVKAVARPVLRHRLLLRPEAQIEGWDADAVLEEILGGVEVPR